MMPNRVRLLVVGIAVCVGWVVNAQSDEFRCTYSRKIECSASGCQDSPIGSAYLLVPKIESLVSATIRAEGPGRLPIIRRCDSKGCSPVVVRASRSGAFVNVSQFDGAYFLKVGTVDLTPDARLGDFVEVASTFLSTITYFGSCAAAMN